MNQSATPTKTLLALLPSRTILFVVFQAGLALALALIGKQAAWPAAARYWPLAATFANLVSIWLLAILLKREGSSLRALYRFDRIHLRTDLVVMLLFLVPVGPIAMLPNTFLANRLFGDSQVAFNLMFNTLPVWAAFLSLTFPLTIAFAELPTYFGFIMPRLENAMHNRWLPWMLASVFLAIQHITLPLLFDARFIIWRALMFLPFALAIGLLLSWRPRLLPFAMIVHALIDLTNVIILISLAI